MPETPAEIASAISAGAFLDRRLCIGRLLCIGSYADDIVVDLHSLMGVFAPLYALLKYHDFPDERSQRLRVWEMYRTRFLFWGQLPFSQSYF